MYGDNGVYTITLTITDDDGGFVVFTAAATVSNVAPTVTARAYMDVAFALQAAGEKWHDLAMTIYEDGSAIGTLTVARSPGSPATQAATLTVRLDMTKAHTATVAYTPLDDAVNGQLNGATPGWVFLTFGDGTQRALFHNFVVRQAATWTWSFNFDGLLGGKEITFEGTGTDPGSDDLRFSWTFGDGGAAGPTWYYNNGLTPDPLPSPWGTFPFTATDTTHHTYASAGTYTVTLVVTDDDGGATTVTLTLNIQIS